MQNSLPGVLRGVCCPYPMVVITVPEKKNDCPKLQLGMFLASRVTPLLLSLVTDDMYWSRADSETDFAINKLFLLLCGWGCLLYVIRFSLLDQIEFTSNELRAGISAMNVRSETRLFVPWTQEFSLRNFERSSSRSLIMSLSIGCSMAEKMVAPRNK